MAYTIRTATIDDIPALAQLHCQGWKDSYVDLVPQDYLDGLTPEEFAEKWKKWMPDDISTALIAEDENGNPAGFSMFGSLQTPVPGQSSIRPIYSAELYAIYLDKDHWGKGLAQMFFKETAAALKDQKHYSMALWVVGGNKRACKFYEKMGGQRIGKKVVEIGGRNVKEACFGWRDTSNLLK
ncbi:MAG: GNAT family N-acetyltransferase [Pseudomonadota bacterium]|nr:GNAT family N-acetyltransferase [Pseudomonadota bacterium]MEC7701710.1 GNAT family N-acetyltransferase [Pseudomonadota bacterium]MEC9236286.1 GNAT family N-acetyltransferase [Pseudomonadota bacterium]MED5423774.1 GNAT family N-acetyltransferase [Pseudomonadota bacterium]